jgi:hypothetical protein
MFTANYIQWKRKMETIAIDPIILEFVKNNFLTITAGSVLFHGLAEVTGWKWMIGIVDVFKAAIGVFRPTK